LITDFINLQLFDTALVLNVHTTAVPTKFPKTV